MLIGAIFLVRPPHPWGWEGIDQYHQLALALARGEPFQTMEVPWGYAYFLAAFYRMFGDRPLAPLVVQVLLNGLIPLLVFLAARVWFDRRIATLAAIVSVGSFNTIYASTQASDAVCTVLFMAAVLAFVEARHGDRPILLAAAGLLCGLATQFRPNLVLLPGLLAIVALVCGRSGRRVAAALLVTLPACVALAPWIARNYRLTGIFLPTSVHGGAQLWYGTLQTGAYRNSRAYNPRRIFEAPSFPYTSLSEAPLVVEARSMGCVDRLDAATIHYWSDLDPVERTVEAAADDHGRLHFDLPAPGRATAVYYYFSARSRPDGRSSTTPELGAAAPFVFFVSPHHLEDLDRHGDLLDFFDIVRTARHETWNEPLPFRDRLADAGITTAASAVTALLEGRGLEEPIVRGVEGRADRLVISFRDGSSIEVPRMWQGLVTDLHVDDGIAAALLTSSRSLVELRERRQHPASSRNRCTGIEGVVINEIYYRREPQMMRRYLALALDNIRRDRTAFVIASVYRAVRQFVVFGSDDVQTVQQFQRSGVVYRMATVVSTIYLLAFVAGVLVGWRRFAPWVPLAFVLYVTVTIAPVLTNMRYTITIQPIMFMFIAVAIATAIDGLQAAAAAAAARTESRTARRP